MSTNNIKIIFTLFLGIFAGSLIVNTFLTSSEIEQQNKQISGIQLIKKETVETEKLNNSDKNVEQKQNTTITLESHRIPVVDNRTSIQTTSNASYTIPVSATSTVLQAMENYQKSNTNFSFTGRNFSGLGFFVDDIGGKKSSAGFYWTLFINNKLSDRGVSTATVVPGDIILWRYQNGL